MRRASVWSMNVVAWCRGDNVKRMNMVVDYVETAWCGVIAWRCGTHGDIGMWWVLTRQHERRGAVWCGVSLMLAPPGFILVMWYLCYVVWWLLVIDFRAPRASLTEYLSKYSALLSFQVSSRKCRSSHLDVVLALRVFGFLQVYFILKLGDLVLSVSYSF